MQRIVVLAARGPAEVAALGWTLAALEAGLPAVYLTLTGTEADAERIAETIRQRLS
jgi:hypothetical protein